MRYKIFIFVGGVILVSSLLKGRVEGRETLIITEKVRKPTIMEEQKNIIIEKGAYVECDIMVAYSVIVRGCIIGKIKAVDVIQIDSSGIVIGKTWQKNLFVDGGSIYDASHVSIITGRVMAYSPRQVKGIGNAEITFPTTSIPGIQTGPAGTYKTKVPPGTYVVKVEATGYIPEGAVIVCKPGKITVKNFELFNREQVTEKESQKPVYQEEIKTKESDLAAEAQWQIAASLYNDEAYEEAIKEFQKLIVNFPESHRIPDAQFYIISAYGYLEKYEKRIEKCKRFLKYFPDNKKVPDVYFQLGATYFNLGRYVDAINIFQVMVDKYPDFDNYNKAGYYLGISYRMLGEKDKAERLMKKFKEEKIEEGELKFVKKKIKNYPELTVDIDVNIPGTQMNNTQSIAVVIGNKNYKKADIPQVEYAHWDAELIKKYLIKTFGYRDGNIIFLEDATKGDFESVFGSRDNYKGKLYNWVKPDKSNVFVYYAGHGAPDIATKEPYIVPVDCDPDYVNLNGYPLDILYSNLSRIQAKSITVVLDACFSGGSNTGMLIAQASPLRTIVVGEKKFENMIIMTASSGDEIASWYPEKRHSLFTYYFLKGITGDGDANKNGVLTLKELKDYVKGEVEYQARREYNREQHPVFLGPESHVILKY